MKTVRADKPKPPVRQTPATRESVVQTAQKIAAEVQKDPKRAANLISQWISGDAKTKPKRKPTTKTVA